RISASTVRGFSSGHVRREGAPGSDRATRSLCRMASAAVRGRGHEVVRNRGLSVTGRARLMLIRSAKVLIVSSMAMAICLLIAIIGQSYVRLLPLNLVAFAAAYLLEGFVGELVLSALLFATCLSPLLYLVVGTRFGYEQLTPWLTALFGAILP